MRNNNFNNKNGRTKYVKLMIYLTFLFILIQLSEELHTRKNQKNMSKIEIEKFVNAVKELKSNGIYDEFVRVHGLSFPTERISTPIFYFECIELLAPSPPEQNPNCWNWAHGSPLFLPWHREYLLLFEQALQKIDAEVYLPYWDWTVDNSTNPSINHLFADYFMGGNGNSSDHMIVTSGPFANWPQIYNGNGPILTRNFSLAGKLPTREQSEDVLTLSLFDQPPYRGNERNEPISFRKALEGYPPMEGWSTSIVGYMHNSVHAYIGGSMVTDYSPNDPLFFLHHCFIDFLWSKWMIEFPDSLYQPQSDGPPGTNYNDYLSPWDGVYNEPSYQFYYQYADVAPSGMNLFVSDLCVPDRNLGYVYEGIELFPSIH